MKKTLFLTISILSFFFLLASSAKAACFVHYYSCDASDVCCDFPTWQCSEGYCRDNQPHCGQYPQPCCLSPNPQCITGENCTDGYCQTATPTPSCGQHGQQCCPTEPKCIFSSEICLGGSCYPPPAPYPCGNSGDRCCEDQPYCHTVGEVCTSDGYCLTPTPAPESGGGIDFTKIKEALVTAVPSIKSEFLPDSSPNVSGIISIILPYLFVIAGLLLLFYLIYGGFHMMIAANDEKGLAEAKGKITNALVGFLLLFVSYWLVQILGYILGIQIF